MYYNSEVISYLQSNKILALKFDHVLSGVGDAVSNQIEIIGAGAKRALYYTSCFTDEYQDVCKQLKTEDIRFAKGVYHLLQRGDVIYEMLSVYFEEIFRFKTPDQLQRIKKNANGRQCAYCGQFSHQPGICFSYSHVGGYWPECKP